MTEDQIERFVESVTDKTDKLFLTGKISEDEYNLRLNRLTMWADKQFSLPKNVRTYPSIS